MGKELNQAAIHNTVSLSASTCAAKHYVGRSSSTLLYLNSPTEGLMAGLFLRELGFPASFQLAIGSARPVLCALVQLCNACHGRYRGPTIYLVQRADSPTSRNVS